MAKMLGRLGWFGQCSCCNCARPKRGMKRLEQRQWTVEVSGDISLEDIAKQVRQADFLYG